MFIIQNISVPFHQYSHLPSEPSSPPTYAVKNENLSNSQQLPSAPTNKPKSNGVDGKPVHIPPLIEVIGDKPKPFKKGLQLTRMESVPETNPENSPTTSTPSGTRNAKGIEASRSQSIGASSPEEILTQKLLASSDRNQEIGVISDDESSNDDTQMTDDVAGSTEKLCNGNNKKIEIV